MNPLSFSLLLALPLSVVINLDTTPQLECVGDCYDTFEEDSDDSNISSSAALHGSDAGSDQSSESSDANADDNCRPDAVEVADIEPAMKGKVAGSWR